MKPESREGYPEPGSEKKSPEEGEEIKYETLAEYIKKTNKVYISKNEISGLEPKLKSQWDELTEKIFLVQERKIVGFRELDLLYKDGQGGMSVLENISGDLTAGNVEEIKIDDEKNVERIMIRFLPNLGFSNADSDNWTRHVMMETLNKIREKRAKKLREERAI